MCVSVHVHMHVLLVRAQVVGVIFSTSTWSLDSSLVVRHGAFICKAFSTLIFVCLAKSTGGFHVTK